MKTTDLKDLHVTSHIKGAAFIFLGVVFLTTGLNGLAYGMEPLFLVTGLLASITGGIWCVRGFAKNRKTERI